MNKNILIIIDEFEEYILALPLIEVLIEQENLKLHVTCLHEKKYYDKAFIVPQHEKLNLEYLELELLQKNNSFTKYYACHIVSTMIDQCHKTHNINQLIIINGTINLLEAVLFAKKHDIEVIHYYASFCYDSIDNQKYIQSIFSLSDKILTGGADISLVVAKLSKAKIYNIGYSLCHLLQYIPPIDDKDMRKILNIKDKYKNIVLFTYSANLNIGIQQNKDILRAITINLTKLPDNTVVILVGKDKQNSRVEMELEEVMKFYDDNRERILFFPKLDVRVYFNLYSMCDLIIGNRTSNIVLSEIAQKRMLYIEPRLDNMQKGKNIIHITDLKILSKKYLLGVMSDPDIQLKDTRIYEEGTDFAEKILKAIKDN